MTQQQITKIAKEYVDRQLATMRKNGLKTLKVSKQEYKSLVERVASNVKG